MPKPIINVEQIARVCHAANCEIQEALGEVRNPRWPFLSEDLKESTKQGVVNAIAGADNEQMHAAWSKNRLDSGWVYGEKKDEALKTHPNLIPYSELPEGQRTKDKVFSDIVRSFEDCFEIVI